ncbi:MAG: asparagine synthase (glutamine-hydrolyzing) [Myxococcales bacterium]|nr:asparagine synthase (glutamine-hydrolyzing) [Myxococcales bacterium]
MCGFCGVLGLSSEAGLEDLEGMTKSLDHRGPDDRGTWHARFGGPGGEWSVGLGHTRLAIIDPSPLGHQPMTAGDGSVTVAYNGEIYNFREIRTELRALGAEFRSDCDTEVLVEGFRLLGTDLLERLNGMFAIAMWDARHSRLLLARDRLGIKPLYYRTDGGVVTFGSELRALRCHHRFRPDIDRVALGTFLRSGFVHGERTIYRDVKRVQPGEFIVWESGRADRMRYWNLLDAAPGLPPTNYREAVDELDRLLGDAVERRLISDVPLGAFLSGGIDSSAVVALMQERSVGRVRTFSIGFRERAYDEAPNARAVAEHLGTDHTELYVDRDQAIGVARDLPELYDEPFADSSAIPTVLLSRLTREHVTVALSGDGGDELLAGYKHYRKLSQLLALHALPRPMPGLLASAARLLPRGSLRSGLRHLRASSTADLAASLVAHFDPCDLARACGEEGARVPERFVEAFEGAPAAGGDAVRRSCYADAATYLPDDILTKVDRASMSVALEARVPLLDHEVVRYALSLPREFVWREGRTKAPLRDVLARRVPTSLTDRPKQGFGIPFETLLAEELRLWADHYLSPARLEEERLLDPAGAGQLVRSALQPGAPRERLWFLLCFERWFARTHRGEAGP